MMQRVESVPAYVLHAAPYQESALLVDIFCREGRIRVMAHGVRRGQSRWRGLLQPAVPILISYAGRTELFTLKSAEALGMPHVLQGRRLISAFYINELLMRVFPLGESCPILFDHYRAVLIGLESDASEQAVLRNFEKKLLKSMGYELCLTVDAETGAPIDLKAQYRFVPEYGIVRVWDPPMAGETLLSGKMLFALENNTWTDAEIMREARVFMRQVLEPHLGGKPLVTRQLWV